MIGGADCARAAVPPSMDSSIVCDSSDEQLELQSSSRPFPGLPSGSSRTLPLPGRRCMTSALDATGAVPGRFGMLLPHGAVIAITSSGNCGQSNRVYISGERRPLNLHVHSFASTFIVLNLVLLVLGVCMVRRRMQNRAEAPGIHFPLGQSGSLSAQTVCNSRRHSIAYTV
jgi:hypothetical protein